MLTKVLLAKPLWFAAGLFSLYFANVLWGKFFPASSSTAFSSNLGGVTEFLLLFSACIFFVVAILQAEATKDERSSAHH